jgi:hypothetical protein
MIHSPKGKGLLAPKPVAAPTQLRDAAVAPDEPTSAEVDRTRVDLVKTALLARKGNGPAPSKANGGRFLIAGWLSPFGHPSAKQAILQRC